MSPALWVWQGRPGAEEEVLCPGVDPERLTEQFRGRVWSLGPRQGSQMAHCCPYYTPPPTTIPGTAPAGAWSPSMAGPGKPLLLTVV